MDANKLKVLREVGYIIPKQCTYCVHFQHDGKKANLFGTCAVKTYDHLKHTGPARQLSVFAHGSCQDESFELHPEVAGMLGAWSEFLEKREFPRSTRHKTKTRY